VPRVNKVSVGVVRTWTLYVEISTTSDVWNPRIAWKHRTKVLLVNLRKASVLSWAFLLPPTQAQSKRNTMVAVDNGGHTNNRGGVTITLQAVTSEAQVSMGYSPLLNFQVDNAMDATSAKCVQVGGQLDGSMGILIIEVVSQSRCKPSRPKRKSAWGIPPF
jgi:hypothetical protein